MSSPTASRRSDVIDILERLNQEQEPAHTLLKQVSQPPRKFQLAFCLVIVWAVLTMAFSTMLAIPLPDPIALLGHRTEFLTYSMQIPVAILVSTLLGPRYGTITIALYLLTGLIGVAMFAGGGGWQYVFEPSFGYLLGYLFVPWTTHRFLDYAYRGSGFFQGRSLWMVIAALVGVSMIHASGILVLMIQMLFGPMTFSQSQAWVVQLSWPLVLYDIVFSFLAIAGVRLVRLFFWFCLY